LRDVLADGSAALFGEVLLAACWASFSRLSDGLRSCRGYAGIGFGFAAVRFGFGGVGLHFSGNFDAIGLDGRGRDADVIFPFNAIRLRRRRGGLGVLFAGGWIACERHSRGRPNPAQAFAVACFQEGKTMSQNKQTVQKYMNAFARSDHAEIVSCLTDDVEWNIPGAFHITGKDAFDQVIENDAFVRSARKDGDLLNAVFCDVCVMQDAKIKHLTSYLMEIGV
jgi:ketosteroid isomerase-like protein